MIERTQLTLHDISQILRKAVDDLERYRGSRSGLLLRQSVQLFQKRLNVPFSKKLLPEFYWFPGPTERRTRHRRRMDLLNLPCLTCWVATARVASSSASIFTTISVIAVVDWTLV